MSRKLTIIGLFVLFAFAGFPTGAHASASGPAAEDKTLTNIVWEQRRGRGWQRSSRGWSCPRRKKRARSSYRNYGQYRRTQVGNRRYRLVRRPYYRNGRRYVRVVRVYF